MSRDKKRRRNKIIDSFIFLKDEIIDLFIFHRRIRIIVHLVLLISGVLSLALLLLMYISHKPGLSPSPSPLEYASDEQMIKGGDDAFKSRDYDRAMNLYLQADRTLSQSLSFENESPSKDEPLLQHYHNTKMLLRARIELTMLAKDVSRLRTTTPP